MSAAKNLYPVQITSKDWSVPVISRKKYITPQKLRRKYYKAQFQNRIEGLVKTSNGANNKTEIISSYPTESGPSSDLDFSYSGNLNKRYLSPNEENIWKKTRKPRRSFRKLIERNLIERKDDP